MKILVAVKRVVDPYVKIRVKSDNLEVETTNVKMSMNPFDEIALEEAIRLREKGQAEEIVLITVGDLASQETLRHGLALGADRAILIQSTIKFCSLNIAQILYAMVLKETPDLVLMGKQSIDGDNNQTPQMLAGLLDWSQATYASHIQIDGKTAVVCREVDAGLETLSVALPTVISVDLRLNEPRYASLPNIMRAKQKPLTTIPVENLGLNLKEHQRIVRVTSPESRRQGEVLQSVTQLVDKLQYVEKIF